MPADISYLEQAGAYDGEVFNQLLSQYSLNSLGGSKTDIHRYSVAESVMSPNDRLSVHDQYMNGRGSVSNSFPSDRLSVHGRYSISDNQSIIGRQSLVVPDEDETSSSRVSASDEVKKFMYVKLLGWCGC